MQFDEIDILGALTSLLKTIKETDKLKSKTLEEWPTVATTKMKFKEDSKAIYQSQELSGLDECNMYYASNYQGYCTKITDCIKSRLAWSDLELMHDILILSTQGWEKLKEDENEEVKNSITRVVERFQIPLKGAGTAVYDILPEFNDIIDYALSYISLSTLYYRSIWWRLFHAPGSTSWSNVLILIELLFSLPASNGKVERIFFLGKFHQSTMRSQLGNDSLDDLLIRNSDKIPLENYSPDASIDSWWSSKARRPWEQGEHIKSNNQVGIYSFQFRLSLQFRL